MSNDNDGMAMVFNEWVRRYSEDPSQFDDILDDGGKPLTDYGRRAAAYYRKVRSDMADSGLLPTTPVVGA